MNSDKGTSLMPIKQVKADNIKNTLRSLLLHTSATKMELVSSTGLSNSTLSDCINNLCKHNIVVTTGFDESIGGRRPSTYALNPHYATFMGIQVCADYVDVSVVNCAGAVLSYERTAITKTLPLITLLYDLIEHTKAQFAEKNLIALGIGFSGKIDYARGIVLNCPEVNWHNVHIKELIERKLFIPTYIDHKINHAALFEHLLGEWRGSDNFLLACDDCRDKLGIYLGGNVARGEENLVGRMQKSDFNAEMFPMIKRLLSLNSMLLGYSDENSELYQSGLFKAFKQDDGYFSRVAGVAALVNWFETIYFIL